MAYEVLSDPDKRKLYNQYGKEGVESEGGGGGQTPEDIFSMFFGQGGGGKRGVRHHIIRDADFRLPDWTMCGYLETIDTADRDTHSCVFGWLLLYRYRLTRAGCLFRVCKGSTLVLVLS